MKLVMLILFILLSNTSVIFSQDTIVDIHCHYYNEYAADVYLRHARKLNVEILKIGEIVIANQDELEETRKHNDQLIALSKSNPKIIPICSVHPYDGDSAINELIRIKNEGVKVVKLHPTVQGLDLHDNRLIELVNEAGRLNMILLIDNSSTTLGNKEGLLDLALECPNTIFIYAHFGAASFRFWSNLKLLTVGNQYKHNVYFDISAIVTLVADSPIEDEFIWTMRTIGIDKMLFGTDFPGWSLEETLEAFNKLDLTEEEKRLIKYKNALNLLN